MSIKLTVRSLAIKTSDFFAYGLQNWHYKHLFLANAKGYIGKKKYDVDSEFERDSKKYWKQHTGKNINPIWHNYYSFCNGVKDVRFVPENLYYAYIEPYYNRKELCKSCDDKSYYSERFPQSASNIPFSRPKTILRNVSGLFYDSDFNILKLDEATKLVLSINTGYVIKESITGAGGNRITFVEPGEIKSKDEILELFKKYRRDFVIEELITQCEELKALNPTSVNTIRYMTFLNEDGVHLLSAVMRIGGKGSRKDNFSTGGMAAGITQDGFIKNVGYDQHYNKYESIHPNGLHFAGIKVPGYKKGLNLVKALHPRFGHFRLISWDIAIDANYEPIIIEFNLTPQSIDFHQINNGPLFGILTEEVLGEVFGRRNG